MSVQVKDISGKIPRGGKRPVLVPVDFSRHSVAAVLFAAQYAECARAPLLVLHVVHEPRNRPGFYRDPKHSRPGFFRPIDDVARDMLTEFMAGLARHDGFGEPIAQAHTRLVSGLPAQRIQEVALHEGAALIVMGSRGRNALARLAVGSVATEVAKHSPVPVTIVKDNAPPEHNTDSAIAAWRARWSDAPLARPEDPLS
jgi:nucleotide-binding universal stress UspA family protein